MQGFKRHTLRAFLAFSAFHAGSTHLQPTAAAVNGSGWAAARHRKRFHSRGTGRGKLDALLHDDESASPARPEDESAGQGDEEEKGVISRLSSGQEEDVLPVPEIGVDEEERHFGEPLRPTREEGEYSPGEEYRGERKKGCLQRRTVMAGAGLRGAKEMRKNRRDDDVPTLPAQRVDRSLTGCPLGKIRTVVHVTIRDMQGREWRVDVVTDNPERAGADFSLADVEELRRVGAMNGVGRPCGTKLSEEVSPVFFGSNRFTQNLAGATPEQKFAEMREHPLLDPERFALFLGDRSAPLHNKEKLLALLGGEEELAKRFPVADMAYGALDASSGSYTYDACNAFLAFNAGTGEDPRVAIREAWRATQSESGGDSDIALDDPTVFMQPEDQERVMGMSYEETKARHDALRARGSREYDLSLFLLEKAGSDVVETALQQLNSLRTPGQEFQSMRHAPPGPLEWAPLWLVGKVEFVPVEEFERRRPEEGGTLSRFFNSGNPFSNIGERATRDLGDARVPLVTWERVEQAFGRGWTPEGFAFGTDRELRNWRLPDGRKVTGRRALTCDADELNELRREAVHWTHRGRYGNAPATELLELLHERWVQNVAGRGENGEQPGASAHDRVVGTDTPHGRAEFGVYTALPVLESGRVVSGEIVEGEESTLKNVVNSSFVDFERMIIRDVNHDNADNQQMFRFLYRDGPGVNRGIQERSCVPAFKPNQFLWRRRAEWGDLTGMGRALVGGALPSTVNGVLERGLRRKWTNAVQALRDLEGGEEERDLPM